MGKVHVFNKSVYQRHSKQLLASFRIQLSMSRQVFVLTSALDRIVITTFASRLRRPEPRS